MYVYFRFEKKIDGHIKFTIKVDKKTRFNHKQKLFPFER